MKGHTVTVPLTAEQRTTLALIRDRIQKGQELPPYCYRVNRDTTPDGLLEREGIMHLHLSPDERNATLFLIQYRTDVVFLGITDHRTFRDDPPGSSLHNLHRHAIAHMEDQLDTEEALNAAKRKADVAAGLKPRSQPASRSSARPGPDKT